MVCTRKRCFLNYKFTSLLHENTIQQILHVRSYFVQIMRISWAHIFKFTIMFICTFVQHMYHYPLPNDLFNLCLFISNVRFCFAATSKRPFSTSLIMTTVQYFSNKTLPNIFVNMVSSDYRVYYKGFCFKCHYKCRIQILMRSHDLILKGSKI